MGAKSNSKKRENFKKRHPEGRTEFAREKRKIKAAKMKAKSIKVFERLHSEGREAYLLKKKQLKKERREAKGKKGLPPDMLREQRFSREKVEFARKKEEAEFIKRAKEETEFAQKMRELLK